MSRPIPKVVPAVCLAALCLAAPLAAQAEPGVVASFSGELSSPAQQDSVAFDVDADRFIVGDDADVGLVFVLSAAPGSSLDPGLIQIHPRGAAEVGGAQKPDTAGSSSSLTLVSLSTGRWPTSARRPPSARPSIPSTSSCRRTPCAWWA